MPENHGPPPRRRMDDALIHLIVLAVGLVVGVLATVSAESGNFASVKTTVEQHTVQLRDLDDKVQKMRDQLTTVLTRLTKDAGP